MLKALKKAKATNPDMFRNFLFGITVAALNLVQIVVILVVSFQK